MRLLSTSFPSELSIADEPAARQERADDDPIVRLLGPYQPGDRVRIRHVDAYGAPLPLGGRCGTILAVLPRGQYDVWFYGVVIVRYESSAFVRLDDQGGASPSAS